MNKHLFYLIALVFASCSQDKEKSPNVFFAGEIVNPTSEKVFLFKNDKVLDSALLDENNRFSFQLTAIEEGLHHFNHGPENQYVFLESGDSVQIRLNTIDFDESLVFSGEGAAINNFLIDLFLANEDEEKSIYASYFQMEPAEFDQRIETLRSEKIRSFSELISEDELSKAEE
jgi:hypothetical protein